MKHRPGFLALARLMLFSGLCACRTAPLLPPADLSQPGWNTRRGQAVWTPKRGAPGIAGDLVVATKDARHAVVQFSKTPIPLVTAQLASGRWSIDYTLNHRLFSGQNAPPARFVWLHLPELLTGSGMTPPWRVNRPETNRWRIENPRTGETLEGYLIP